MRVFRLALLALTLAALSAVLSGVAMLTGPPASPSNETYLLHCYFTPESDDGGVYIVRVAGVREAQTPQELEGYKELIVTLNISYRGPGLGEATIGPGSLACDSRTPPPLVVEVVKGWSGKVTAASLTVATVSIGFWNSKGAVKVEYLGVEGQTRIIAGEESTVTISDKIAFKIVIGDS